MYNSGLENQLIVPDIVDIMVDYVSIQQDIDERRIKAAAIIAQNIDIKRVIGKDNLNRLIDDGETEMNAADKELLQLIIPPLCYYTYSRLLLSFHGNYTDSGFENDELAAARNEAKSVAKEMKGVGEAFMQEVILFLEEENPDTPAEIEKLTPRVRTFGGKEYRGSN